MAPEFAYVTAKFGALAPFAKMADLLAELLPVSGAVNACTVRNRTRRVDERIARLHPEGAADPDIDAVTPAVVIGLDGGYLRSRHRRPERNFEVIAGKALNLDGFQHRFAFARNGNSASEFADAIVSAGVRLDTPATVLCDGDPGLWKLQRQGLWRGRSSACLGRLARLTRRFDAAHVRDVKGAAAVQQPATRADLSPLAGGARSAAT